MRYKEGDFFPLSALQHILFCERQAALIHVEKIWLDNALTIDGQHAHRRVDAIAPRRERRGDTVILRGLWLRSEELGIIGKADVVEAYRVPESRNDAPGVGPQGVHLDGLPGHWRFFPVEYKRGKPKRHRADEVQLCAQAMCIEEMKSVEIPGGALFYGRTKRRQEVEFDQELRALVGFAAERMRHLLESGRTPLPVADERCRSCSLVDACLPGQASSKAGSLHVSNMIQGHLKKGGPD